MIAAAAQQPQNLQWWGEYDFQLNQTRAWQFGSLLFQLHRGEHEWRLEYHRPQYQNDDEQEWQVLPMDMAFPAPIKIERYMFKQSSAKFTLMPRLADRSVVIKPVDPIYIPAGQRSTLYISTPLWIAGFVENQKNPLFELPMIYPKDTWFGPDKQQGEVCYATSVVGRTDLSLLTPRAFRAVTPVDFHNISNQQLRLDKMNIPVTALPLFYSPQTNRLWTSQIKVLHEGMAHAPRIRIDNETPPQQAGKVIALQSPREAGNALFNMFDSFF